MIRFLPIASLLLFVAIVSPALSATSLTLQEANALFSQGNAAYRSQKYDEAADAYHQLLDAGYDSAQVLYNLGTTSARLEDFGEALGYLIRANRLAPRDENIRANLQRVKQQRAKEAGLSDEQVAAITAENLWTRIIGILTAEEWLAIIWVALMIGSIGAVMVMAAKSRWPGIIGKTLIAVGITVLVIVAVPAAMQIYQTRIVQQAIAINPGDVLSGPAQRFTRVAQLQEGQVVRYLGQQNAGFSRVRLENGLQGYVESSHLMDLQ